MIETSPGAWLWWGLAMLLASNATIRFVRFLPWSQQCRSSAAPLAFGLALAPFLLGFISMLALAALANSSHAAHSAFIFIVLALCNLLTFRAVPASSPLAKTRYSCGERTMLLLLALFACTLLLNAVRLPLTQTDSLEYATVGRILYESRTLASYPAIHPEQSVSGFYGAWTHPPLYVSLIYAANLLQGHADTPGLMRLIAPWCALLATFLAFAVGSLIDRRTGLASALLFLATPLLLIGAEAALIDPLPVLGISLAFSSLFFFTGSPRRQGTIQGTTLGLALWTHSQAILFPILLIAALGMHYGWRRWKSLTAQLLPFLAVALLVGIWPYMRNYITLGTPVSDSPAIFTLASLYWDDFFRIGRGVDSLTAQIQYGLLKGWFTPEAYGIMFWLMLLGVWHLRNSAHKRLILTALAVVAVYHAGVAASIALGLSQMIRIERYMLILMPCTALIAGFALARCTRLCAYAAVLLLGLQLGVIGWQRMHNGDSGIPAMTFIQQHLPPDAVVLAMNPADMYYANRRMVSYLDPRMTSFYSEPSPENAVAALKALGIGYVYVTAGALPPYYNSTLQTITADPKLTTLAYDSGGNQIYALGGHATAGKSTDITPGAILWTKTAKILIGGRKAFGSIPLGSSVLEGGSASELRVPLDLFQRDVGTLLQSGERAIALSGDQEYRLTMELEGYGLLRIWLHQFDKDGKLLSPPKPPFSEMILGAGQPLKTFPFRFKALPQAHYLQVGIMHYGNSRLLIRRAALAPVR